MNVALAVIHEENGVFGVSWPDFPGVVTGGDTMEEAARKANEALGFHIAGMIEDGAPLPLLRSQEELFADPETAETLKGSILLLTRFDLPEPHVGDGA